MSYMPHSVLRKMGIDSEDIRISENDVIAVSSGLFACYTLIEMVVDFNAGRLATNCIMTGNVLLNGKPRRVNSGGPVSI